MDFYIGKEAVPRHRLQAMLARGNFDGALQLARAHSMDETDVHAARLLWLLSAGGSGIRPRAVLAIDTGTSGVVCQLRSAVVGWSIQKAASISAQ